MVDSSSSRLRIDSIADELKVIVHKESAKDTPVIGVESAACVAGVGIGLPAKRRDSVGRITDQGLNIQSGVRVVSFSGEMQEEKGVVLQTEVAVGEQEKVFPVGMTTVLYSMYIPGEPSVVFDVIPKSGIQSAVPSISSIDTYLPIMLPSKPVCQGCPGMMKLAVKMSSPSVMAMVGKSVQRSLFSGFPGST